MKWPFSKMRVAVPALETIPHETICPLCLERFSSGQIVVQYPFCADCSSEGIDFEVQPFEAYLRSKSVDELEDMITRWDEAEGFRPQYKAVKRKRMIDILETLKQKI